MEFIEVLETTRFKLNQDNITGNFVKKEHTNTNHVELIEVLETTTLKIIISGIFVKKSKNETKPFTCDECGQTFEKKFNVKEHSNTNKVFEITEDNNLW